MGRVAKICIVNDVFLGGGLETRVKGQVEYLNSVGVQVDLICGEYTNTNNVKFNNVVKGRKFLGISANELYEEILFLAEYFKSNRIDVVDCHNYYSVVAAIAANIAGIPAVFTAHGQYCLDYDINSPVAHILKRYLMRFGFSERLAVAEYVSAIGSGFGDFKILRNGISKDDYSQSRLPADGRLAIVTRLDGVKAPLLRGVVDNLSSKNVKQLDIYGEGEGRADIEAYVHESGLGDKVRFMGWARDTKDELCNNYDIVFGMGRSVIEALAMGVPSIILGYGGVAYARSSDTIDEARKFNFTSWRSLPSAAIADLIDDVLNGPSRYISVDGFISDDMEESTIWKSYLGIVSNLKASNIRGSDLLLAIGSITDESPYERNYQLLNRIKQILHGFIDEDIYELNRHLDRSAIDGRFTYENDMFTQKIGELEKKIHSSSLWLIFRARLVRCKRFLVRMTRKEVDGE